MQFTPADCYQISGSSVLNLEGPASSQNELADCPATLQVESVSEAEDSSPRSMKTFYSIHALVILVVLSLVGVLFNGTLFSWHPALMSLGYLGFMTEGVVAAIKFRSLEGQERVRAIQFHALLQVAASACIAGAFYAIYQNKVIHTSQVIFCFSNFECAKQCLSVLETPMDAFTHQAR